MRVRDLPGTMPVSACSHVLRGERPARSVAFRNGVNVTCQETDHGPFGEEVRHLTLAEVLQALPWLGGFEIEPGERKELGADGIWHLCDPGEDAGPVARWATGAQREAYYDERCREIAEEQARLIAERLAARKAKAREYRAGKPPSKEGSHG